MKGCDLDMTVHLNLDKYEEGSEVHPDDSILLEFGMMAYRHFVRNF